MFAGHVGAALAIGRADRRLNLGVLILAALFLDALLWLFVLLGWEFASIPTDFGKSHQVQFVFPYSHGLAGSAAWALLGALATYSWYRRLGATRLRPAVLVGVAVLSHWVLDALVHVPELPLMGSHSQTVGLGWWRHMPLALAVEALILAVGLWLYVPGALLSRGRKAGLCVLGAMILAFTIVGMTIAPAPPSVTTMALSSLIIVVVVTLLAWRLTAIPGERRA